MSCLKKEQTRPETEQTGLTYSGDTTPQSPSCKNADKTTSIALGKTGLAGSELQR